MHQPALILFDLDGVLVHYDYAVRIETLAGRVGASAAAIKGALFDSGLEHESDLGRVTANEQASTLAQRLSVPVTVADCVAARGAAMQVDREMLRIAHHVAESSDVAILTNNGLFVRDYLAAMCPLLFPLFAGRVLCSGQFGVAKPDPQIFQHALAALGSTPHDTLFIDDKAANADGARRAGLAAIHFTGAETLAAELISRGFDKELSDAF